VVAAACSARSGIEDLRLAIASQGLLEGLVPEILVQLVGDAPGEDLATVPVHDRHQIHKPEGHGNVGYISISDLICLIDAQVSEEVGNIL
jgi:hypothetical protein